MFNYVRAMNHGLARLDATPISIGLLREIHRELLAGTRGHALAPGELRTTQNWIGPPGSPLAEATFVFEENGSAYAALSIANDTCRPSMVAWMPALPLAGSRARASVSPAM